MTRVDSSNATQAAAHTGHKAGDKAGDKAVLREAAAPTESPAWYGMEVLQDSLEFHQDLRGDAPPINAASGILVDADSGAILWERAEHTAMSPASTTKILTALVTLENFPPDKLVEVTPDALREQTDETLMGLVAGEKLTVQELLTGALMVSGNDAATTLAVDTVGLDRFVAAMNAQVKALGLRDSHFTTPVGLEDPAQKTSAYDLATLATATVNHFPLFRQIVATVHTVLPGTATHHTYELWNLNQLLGTYPGASGIKPGWTGDAGPCLVGMAERDGHRLISVLLNAPLVFNESRQLLDWGFVQEGLHPVLPPTPAPPPPPKPAVPAAAPQPSPAHTRAR